MASRWTLLGGADHWGRASAPALVAEVVAVAAAAAPAAADVADADRRGEEEGEGRWINRGATEDEGEGFVRNAI